MSVDDDEVKKDDDGKDEERPWDSEGYVDVIEGGIPLGRTVWMEGE